MCVMHAIRPPLWIMLKYLRSGPAKKLFFTGTPPIQIISTWQILWGGNEKTNRLSNKASTAWSCAEDQILENKNLRNMILNICTERSVKHFFRIYLPVREHTWLIGSGGVLQSWVRLQTSHLFRLPATSSTDGIHKGARLAISRQFWATWRICSLSWS